MQFLQYTPNISKNWIYIYIYVYIFYLCIFYLYFIYVYVYVYLQNIQLFTRFLLLWEFDLQNNSVFNSFIY